MNNISLDFTDLFKSSGPKNDLALLKSASDIEYVYSSKYLPVVDADDNNNWIKNKLKELNFDFQDEVFSPKISKCFQNLISEACSNISPNSNACNNFPAAGALAITMQRTLNNMQ